MKTKITFLFLFIIPFLTFAQQFNTPGDNEGFVIVGTTTNTLVANGTDLVLTMAKSGNPVIATATANIDADTNNYLEISLKNNSTTDQLRFSNTNPAVAPFSNIVITKGDTSYQTYYVDITAWTGIVNVLSIVGKPTTGGYTFVGAGETISIDYIKPVVSLPIVVTPEVNTFSFDGASNGGFTTLLRATAVQATESSKETLKITCTAANTGNSKVSLAAGVAHVGGLNKYAHIIIKNTSSNNAFQIAGLVGGVVKSFNPKPVFTANDTDYMTYDFDLTTWDDANQQPDLIIGVKSTWAATGVYAVNDQVISSNSTYKNLTGINTTNNPRADIIANAAAVPPLPQNWELVGIEGALLDITNPIYIDQIVFDNEKGNLGNRDFGSKSNTIAIYPNPARNVLNVKSDNTISKIDVYDMQGKKVASKNNTSDINVSSLGKGIYIISVLQDNGSVASKQFVKE
ncbi:T9SS type A sorting domain-containing protein [Flavobacterium luteum]|uniref:T9SS type A sorting domain-containing protein n=1 Tax=Flavobacterium luteum TaxID=2026654 RepID=A0A7J5AD70_9FLAO|nr:T9SS type A sorting domain-containing protein [Flavobacterium luteum]KAB1155470.1 T9SS type A sorting domain-containing protein [Flavobacterium luteum]